MLDLPISSHSSYSSATQSSPCTDSCEPDLDPECVGDSGAWCVGHEYTNDNEALLSRKEREEGWWIAGFGDFCVFLGEAKGSGMRVDYILGLLGLVCTEGWDRSSTQVRVVEELGAIDVN